MNKDLTTNPEAIYRLQSDVYLSYDKNLDCSRVLKLSDDDLYYQADRVAGEILKSINGRDTFRQIVTAAASQYSSNHFDDIWKNALGLFDELLAKKLIEKVK